jgi:mannose-1-phosphate guanylyltransferase
MKPTCYSVIIAGGKGTRFWPLSRSQKPKQLLKIFGAKSLIAQTLDRALFLADQNHTLVVTVAEQLGALRKELGRLPRSNFLAEPQGKNTAPCIGLAALEVATRDPAATMVILPADHWIADLPAFRRTLKEAVELANHYEGLITLGIRPGYPETGYGYIVKGKRLKTKTRVAAYEVKKFKEKPSQATAQRLIRQGSLWNSGMFVWRASTLLELIRRYQPKIWQGLEQIREVAKGKPLTIPHPGLRSTIIKEYDRMPNISVDHAVLEKAGSEGKVLTVETNLSWSDVGSWAAVHRLMRQDAHGNAGNGRWLGFGAKDCLIHAPNRLVVLLGMKDAVVVDTPDALLVGDLKRSQDVRELVDQLKQKGYGAYTVK